MQVLHDSNIFTYTEQVIRMSHEVTLHLVFSEGGVAFTLNNKKMCEAVYC